MISSQVPLALIYVQAYIRLLTHICLVQLHLHNMGNLSFMLNDPTIALICLFTVLFVLSWVLTKRMFFIVLALAGCGWLLGFLVGYFR